MKDLLNYYYFINPDKIHLHNDNYYFNYNNNLFCFYLYKYNLDEVNSIFELNNYMLFYNYKVNRIFLNSKSSILTKKDNKYYVLVELLYHCQDKIELKNIVDFSKLSFNVTKDNLLNHTDWYSLWCLKVDNIEYILEHIKNKYKYLYSATFYYIGLAENSICYFKYLNYQNNNIGICHKRIKLSDTLTDFYNPINLIIDYKVRDLAEYYKTMFFYKNIDIKNIIESFKLLKLSNIDYIYFYIRMLYPSYYFDLFDSVINENIDELQINKIIMLQSDYEYLLYELYLVIKQHVNIAQIDWINKKFAN